MLLQQFFLSARNAADALPLTHAAAWNCARASQVLLVAWPDSIRSPNRHGEFPIHCVDTDATEALDVLLSAWSESILQPNRYGRTPVHQAADGVSCTGLRRMLQRCPEAARIPSATSPREYPIHTAVGNDSLEGVDLLLEAWPEGIRAVTDSGDLPIHQEAVRLDMCSSTAILERLLAAWPESVHVANRWGRSPVEIAQGKNSEALRLLSTYT